MERMLRLLLYLMCWQMSWADKNTTCNDTRAAEGADFAQEFVYSDSCDSVCSKSCPVSGGDSCLSTTSLDGTCGPYASCGANGCECDSNIDIDLENFETEAAVTIDCEETFITVRIDKCAANAVDFSLDDMYMDGPGDYVDGLSLQTDGDNNCVGKIAFHDNRMVYEFMILNDLTACNTERTETGEEIVYKNAVHGVFNMGNGGPAITRSKYVHINFACVFSDTQTLTLGNELISVIREFTLKGTGTAPVTLTTGIYSDDTYTTPVSAGSEYPVGHALYARMTTDLMDSNSALIIMNVHATPSSSASDPMRFYLIRDGCPTAAASAAVSIIQNGVDQEVRFSFAFLYFLSLPLRRQQIFIHISLDICTKADADCPPDCSGSGRRKRSSGITDRVISLGPLIITGKPEGKGESGGETEPDPEVISNPGDDVPTVTSVESNEAGRDVPTVPAMTHKNTLDDAPDVIKISDLGSIAVGSNLSYIPFMVGCGVLFVLLLLFSYYDVGILWWKFRKSKNSKGSEIIVSM